MARVGMSLSQLAAEIESRAEQKKDLIVPVSKLDIAVIDDQPKLIVSNGTDTAFDINPVAHAQIAEYMGIPMQYYRRMLENDPVLLANNVRRWMQDKIKNGEGRMVRLLGSTLRAMLSNGFRVTLENEDLLEAALPALKSIDAMIVSCAVTDTRMYLKVVDKSVQVDLPSGAKLGEGHVRIRTMSPALILGNSEVGHGSFFVDYGVWDGYCTNLAGFGSAFRRVHSGARHELTADAYELLSDETKTATDRATLMQVGDIIKGAFNRAKFDANLAKMRDAVADPIPVTDVVQVVTRAARKFNFSKIETDGIQAALLEGADYTRFGLQAAVTQFSQSTEVSYDRASELEKIGGDVIELAPSQWRELVAA
jgi:hypothetical protein